MKKSPKVGWMAVGLLAAWSVGCGGASKPGAQVPHGVDVTLAAPPVASLTEIPLAGVLKVANPGGGPLHFRLAGLRRDTEAMVASVRVEEDVLKLAPAPGVEGLAGVQLVAVDARGTVSAPFTLALEVDSLAPRVEAPSIEVRGQEVLVRVPFHDWKLDVSRTLPSSAWVLVKGDRGGVLCGTFTAGKVDASITLVDQAGNRTEVRLDPKVGP